MKDDECENHPATCWEDILKNPKCGIIFGLLSVILIWLVVPAVFWTAAPNWETRGQVGDSFGSVNALLSSLALFGVLVTIWFQKQELEVQRKELELTREELRRSAEAQESSSESLFQQIENQVTASKINGLSAILASLSAERSRLDQRKSKLGSSISPIARAEFFAVKENAEHLAEKEKMLIGKIELLIGEADHATEVS